MKVNGSQPGEVNHLIPVSQLEPYMIECLTCGEVFVWFPKGEVVPKPAPGERVQ